MCTTHKKHNVHKHCIMCFSDIQISIREIATGLDFELKWMGENIEKRIMIQRWVKDGKRCVGRNKNITVVCRYKDFLYFSFSTRRVRKRSVRTCVLKAGGSVRVIAHRNESFRQIVEQLHDKNENAYLSVVMAVMSFKAFF